MKAKSKNPYEWRIEYVANGMSDKGNFETGFLPGVINAHTHGIDRFNHQEFQIVAGYQPDEVAYLLNTLGDRVKAGERFQAGDFVSGLYTDCDVRLDEAEECGRTVLRLIIPDEKNRFPEDPNCSDWFKNQLLPSEVLWWNSENILSESEIFDYAEESILNYFHEKGLFATDLDIYYRTYAVNEEDYSLCYVTVQADMREDGLDEVLEEIEITIDVFQAEEIKILAPNGELICYFTVERC